eukprot:UN01982
MYETLAGELNLPCSRQTLSVGDYVWTATKGNQTFVLPMIIERKTMDDLAGSIVDGRFLEQKHRLKKTGSRQLIYLVEGRDETVIAAPGFCDNRDKALSMIKMAIYETEIQAEFMVHRTDHVRGSAFYIKTLNTQLKNHINRTYSNSPKDEIRFTKDYCVASYDVFQEIFSKKYHLKPETSQEQFALCLLDR